MYHHFEWTWGKGFWFSSIFFFFNLFKKEKKMTQFIRNFHMTFSFTDPWRRWAQNHGIYSIFKVAAKLWPKHQTLFVWSWCRFGNAGSLYSWVTVFLATRRGKKKSKPSNSIILAQLTPFLFFPQFQVKFDKKAKRATSVDDTRFYLLHLGLLREYLEMEFIEVKDKLSFDYDIEKIIDDWIFMCYMVGNDFIPHLPNLHISANALPILYKTYRETLPELDGIIYWL